MVHQTGVQRTDLNKALQGFDILFDNKLGLYPHKKINIELLPNSKPYHARPYSVPMWYTKKPFFKMRGDDSHPQIRHDTVGRSNCHVLVSCIRLQLEGIGRAHNRPSNQTSLSHSLQAVGFSWNHIAVLQVEYDTVWPDP